MNSIPFWTCLVISLILSAVSAGHWASHTTTHTNKPEDEAAIEKLAVEAVKNERDRPGARSYHQCREDILEERYSTQVRHGADTGFVIRVSLAAAFALVTLILGLILAWEGSGLGEYLRARARLQEARAEKYAKTLDDLIALQQKISAIDRHDT